jgi:hypothetical protein
MKKVRITVSKGSRGKDFKIFNSPESLYVWLNDPDLQLDPEMDPSLGNVVRLKQGEVMEAEWCGCEFVYEEDELLFRADYIRIGKLISAPTFFSGGKNVVGIQDGWIMSDTIAFKSYTDGLTRTTKLTPRSRHKFDLDELFSAREAYDSMEEDEEQNQEKTLH